MRTAEQFVSWAFVSRACHSSCTYQHSSSLAAVESTVKETENKSWHYRSAMWRLKGLFKISKLLRMVAHTCNPNYSGGRLRGLRSRPVLGKKTQNPTPKITKANKGLGAWLKWWTDCLASIRS
jgi:hypothetical protein